MDYFGHDMIVYGAAVCVVLFVCLFCYVLMHVNNMHQLGLLLILFGIFFGGWLTFTAGVLLVALHHILDYLGEAP